MIESDLTRLTVNLIPTAMRALDQAADLERLSRTDAVNRALQCYADLVEAAVLGSGRFVYETPDGGELEVVMRRPRRRWRRPTKRRLGLCAAVLVYLAVVAAVILMSIFMF